MSCSDLHGANFTLVVQTYCLRDVHVNMAGGVTCSLGSAGRQRVREQLDVTTVYT
jgi:hypothetical protein